MVISAKCRATLTITGRVQGVGYRYFTLQKARHLHLNGFVQNRPNNQVKCIVEGDTDIVKEFLEYLHEGPPLARVERIEVQWDDYTNQFSGFEVRF